MNINIKKILKKWGFDFYNLIYINKKKMNMKRINQLEVSDLIKQHLKSSIELLEKEQTFEDPSEFIEWKEELYIHIMTMKIIHEWHYK